jgi:ABC-type transport system involved in multi-copper enzyme maturation permease subunit
MRLVGAELLKIRRRWASYIVLGLLLGLMALVFVLLGVAARDSPGGGSTFLRFPNAYGILSQFVFGLGGLLALCYAAAIGGADWNWGVFRVVIARGESRAAYVLAKFAGLVIALAVGVVIAFIAGILLVFVAASLGGIGAGNPFAVSALDDLGSSLGLGLPVLLERAAIGYAVAMLLRSQLAGVIAGIALFIGEGILTAILFALAFSARFGDGGPTGAVSGNQWYQFLPFSIGDSVLSAGPGISADPSELFLEPVPLPLALAVTFGYIVVALALSVIYAERTEISS